MLKRKRSEVENFCGQDNEKSLLAEMYLQLGVKACGESVWELAIVAFTCYLELFPDDAFVLDKRGIALGNIYHYSEAIDDFTRVINIDNAYFPAYNNRGLSYYKNDMLTEAIADYDKAIQLCPDVAVFYANRGLAYKEKGDFKAALRDYNTALKMEPKLTETHNYRGELYAEIGEYKKAGADFDRELFINPSDSNAWANSMLVASMLK